MDKSSYHQHFWNIISQIPSGKVATYGQIAELAGFPNMARAVGRTLSQLPSGTHLPWHRVINAKGTLSFPKESDSYITQKKRLADEGIPMLNGKIKLATYQWQP